MAEGMSLAEIQSEVKILEVAWLLPASGIFRTDNPGEQYPHHVPADTIIVAKPFKFEKTIDW